MLIRIPFILLACLAPTAPKVCKNGVIGEQESSGPAQVSSPDESRPVVTPGGPLPISDPTPPPAFEIVELEDGTGNQEGESCDGFSII